MLNRSPRASSNAGRLAARAAAALLFAAAPLAAAQDGAAPPELGGPQAPAPADSRVEPPSSEEPSLEEPVGDGAIEFDAPPADEPSIAEPPPSLDAGRDPARAGDPEYFYGESDWRAYAEGYTLYYRNYADGQVGGLVGREYYAPGGDRVIFVYFDGRCFDGSWSENAGVFCFQYDGTHCFEHIAREGQVFARELDGDEQIVTRRTNEVLSCTPDPVSQAPGPAGPLARLLAGLEAPTAAARRMSTTNASIPNASISNASTWDVSTGGAPGPAAAREEPTR